MRELWYCPKCKRFLDKPRLGTKVFCTYPSHKEAILAKVFVSFEDHEKALVKIRSENIDKWLRRKGGFLNLSETIITAKLVLKFIEKMPKPNSVSFEWLKKEIEKARERHRKSWVEASKHGVGPCDCLIEGRENGCEVNSVLNRLFRAIKKEVERK